MNMGEKIKLLRKKKGLSQESLAQALGVSFQAVSKWETGNTTPDVALVPAIAAFFGVSTDTLFDYNVLDIERKAWEICKAAAPLRASEPERAEAMLREGLRQFPGNEKLLTVLLYTLLSMDGRAEDTVEICNTLIEYAEDEGIRCDAYNILAMTYMAMGRQELVEPTIEKIPEFHFTKLECRAKLLRGEKAMDAARLQVNMSAKCTLEMLQILSRGYEEQGQQNKAAACRRIAQAILDAFRQEEGENLEVPGYEWIEAMAENMK